MGIYSFINPTKSTNKDSGHTLSSLVSMPFPKKSYPECVFSVLSLSSKGGNPHVITYTQNMGEKVLKEERSHTHDSVLHSHQYN